MANYDEWKQKYSALDDSQKQKWNDKISWMDANSEARQFTERYNQEMNNNQQSNNNSSNFNNQNGTNWQNQTNFETPTVQKTESQNNFNQNNQTYNYDPEEKLDTDMFWASDGKVVVKEWTAKDTWMPDYQLDSDARTKEITDNLNAYWQTNREYFQDRNTYNNMFHYNERSDQQKAILDSYWKKKEDMNVAEKYNTADGIKSWMNDAEITPDQLNYIKEYSPEAYREWQQKQIDDINLRIANLATPADPTSNAELFNSLLNKLGLEPWDPYQIYDNWYNMAERLWVFSDSEKLKSYQNQLDANHSKMESIMSRYAASTWWTVSDALAAARMNKALAPYQQREVDLQNSYTTLLNGRNSNLAIANQSAQALAMQAQEDQRIWNQRLQGLGFAMTTASYRSPEQQAQLQLQTAQIQNDMNLLQTSMQNDLNRYNAYATAKMQNQLQSELTDLSVTDPTQLRANLNNVLSSYYSQWGDIIQRPQSQVVDDVIAYAQKNGISIAEALKKNFIEPLQWKTEYKNAIAGKYAAPTSTTSAWYSKITINWKDYLTMWWRIIDPTTLWIGTWDLSNVKPYNLVSVETMENWIDAFSVGKNKGDNYWECWKFVNDYLVSIGVTDANNRYFGNETIDTRRQRCNSQTAAKWAVAVFDYGIISSDNKNHGHVAVVTQTYSDWSFDVIESNYPWWWKVNKRHVEKNDANLQGFINYSLWASSSQWYNTQDPYSWVSKYTSTWKQINAGGWITSLEKSFDRWEKLTDTRRKDLYSAYWVDVSELNEQRERYMNYVETKQMVDSLLDVKARAMKLKEWAEKDTNKDLKWWMDIDIANQWYAGFWQDMFTKDSTISSIQEWKALFDNLMSNAGFQKYLDMKDKWAQFWIMTDSEWNKVDNSVAPLKREQKDAVFLQNLNSMIKWYDEVLMQLWYDSSEWAKPDTAEQVEITPNQWMWSWDVITMVIDGQVRYSYDWWKTRY